MIPICTLEISRVQISTLEKKHIFHIYVHIYVCMCVHTNTIIIYLYVFQKPNNIFISDNGIDSSQQRSTPIRNLKKQKVIWIV